MTLRGGGGTSGLRALREPSSGDDCSLRLTNLPSQGFGLTFDSAGLRPAASAPVGDVPWPGTSLYSTEIELHAPETAGLHAWEAVAPDAGGENDRPMHAGTCTRFQIRAVTAPEYLVKVVAVDTQSHAQLQGAKVVVHPYRAVTDAHGVAEIRVPKGAYRLLVSGRDHFPFRSDGEIVADVTIEAELAKDLGPSDAELWS